MEELKACPFCKGEGKWWGGYLTGVRTYCQKCRAKINGETKAEVIAIWNNRPIEEALEAKVKVAEDLIKKNKKYVQYYDHQRFNSSDAYDNWQEIEEYIKQIGSK